MKKKFKQEISILLALILYSLILVNGQQSWQKLNDPVLKEVAAHFSSPPAENSITLWWGWDGPVNDSVIIHDLDLIKSFGFNSVMIEAGYGMTYPYLSDGWFSLVKFAVEQAKKRNMRVWIEDEGKYPSGFAGGKFSSDRPDLKMRGLAVNEIIRATTGDSVFRKLPRNTLSAVAYNSEDKTTKIIDISSGELNWSVPKGNWSIYIAGHQFRSSATRSVNNPTRGKDTTASLMDYLNPKATQQFINWTYEQYKKYIGSEFGVTFMGFMGDEPDFAYTPWSTGILEEFITRKGYNIKPHLASFFVPEPDENARRMKADYWDVWSDLFRDNFFSKLAEWCRGNNIEYIVHLNHEDNLPDLIKSSGDYFKDMRNVGVPGVDAIWSQIWMDHVADYPKLASSAAHLFGKPRAFTESFAAYTHRPTVGQAKWVLDYQLVRGINSIQIMFMSASSSKVNSGVPPDITFKPVNQNASGISFFMSDSFPAIAAYLNRASYLLSRGRPAAQIGVYFPTLSLWYGDNESNRCALKIARQLMEIRQDFDFVDEQSLSSMSISGNGALENLSGQEYKAMIIPSVNIISEKSLEQLKKFSASGGIVIFLGEKPSLTVGKNFLNAGQTGDLTWAIQDETAELTPRIIKLLPPPDIRIDRSLPELKYLHRTWKDADLYFLFNEGKNQISFNIDLPGKGKSRIWNASTGKISTFRGTAVSLDPWETIFITKKRNND